MKFRGPFLLALVVTVAHAQLTASQRQADFRSLVDLYARRYAAVQWKLTLFQFDALDLTPWIPRVAAVSNDLDFYNLMVEYVSDLQDAHDQYNLPSDFEAHLGFTADIYDGKVLIDSVDRAALLINLYTFQVGDELVSIDGVPAAQLVQTFSRYVSGGNPRTVQRMAAGFITDRYQAQDPYAAQIGDSALVVVNQQTGGAKSYTIHWRKAGTELTQLGASPGPRVYRHFWSPSAATGTRRRDRAAPAKPLPFYEQFLQRFQDYTLPGRINVLGFDELKPVFTLPSNFVLRLGSKSYDSYFTGTYTAPDGTRIGYLRIPDFLYTYLPDLDTEIQFFESNTDVLVVDVMRNPGGDVCNAEETLARLTGSPFQGAAAQVRPDWSDILSTNEALSSAQTGGAPPDTVAQLLMYQSAFATAFQSTANTTALPLCGSTLDRTPVASPYTKPVLLLVDEMSASAADIFASLVQDNHVAPLFGYRTMGAGGSPEADYIGVYTEGSTTVTRSLVVRAQPVVTPDYPTTQYIENVGVRPDTVADYMTTDNLLNQGATFVAAFTDAAAKLAHPAH